MREIRAPRYAEGVQPEIIQAITDELPYASFYKALAWYSEYVPLLSPQATRLLGCNDRYFLLTVLLNRPDAIHPWIYDRCREVEADPDGYLDLWARMHFKSTVITFAGSVQEILIDPEETICILSNTKEIATPFMSQIMNELENNGYLKETYSDVLWSDPRNQSDRWSLKEGLVVKRKSNRREASIEGHSLMKLPVGKHFGILTYDDAITEANVTNPEQIQKATRQISLSRNLGNIGHTRRRFIGTRYSYADSYGELLDEHIVKERIYPATDDGTLNGRPVLLTQQDWEEHKRDQRHTIAAQMLQNPVAGNENLFRMSWLDNLSYMLRPTTMRVCIIGDPSAGRHKTSDRTAIAVIGIDTLDNRYLLDGYCHRMPQSERWQKLLELWRKWANPDKMPGVQVCEVGWERYGMQEDIEYFEREMRRLEISFPIKELSWVRERGKESKPSRIGRLEPDFRLARFHLPGKVWTPDLGTATWKIHFDRGPLLTRAGVPIVDPKTGEEIIDDIEETAKVEYQIWRETGAERAARERGEAWRIISPIRRLDEDGNIYDLTRIFFEEYRLYPFATHDDLIDAMSRLYDMEPRPASKIERETEAAQVHDYVDA